MITIHDVEQGTPEWLALRKDLYTGHNAHKLLKHQGLVKVLDGVVSPYAISEITGFKGNFWTKRGHILEDEAVELYEAITGTSVNRAGFVTNSIYPTAGYSPDGLPPIPVLEIKCFDIPEHMQLIKAKIKLEILAQIHFGLLITGRPFAHLVPYNPSEELAVEDQFKIITIKADRQIANNFRSKLKP